MKSNQTTKSMALKATLVILAFSPFTVSTPSFATDDCEFCDRGAVVSKCENPDLPANWEELYEPYWECMDRELPKDDPNVTMSQGPDAFASRRCKHLHPRIDFTTASSIATQIAELHTTACFHMIRRDIIEAYRARGEREGWGKLVKPANYKIPEYSFEVVFDTVTEEIIDREGKPGSSLTIDLYYDGDERIHVKSWKTTSPTYTITSNTNRMFENPDALMRQVAPLQNLLWDFEKTPVECDIRPQKKEIFPGQMIDIIISNCKGRKGQPSRDFQRLVATAKHGYIANGAPVPDPEYEAFSYGDGNVKIKYQAPGNCNNKEDVISVYNSCDIYNSTLHPLELTEKNKEIGEAKVKLICEKGYITVTRKFTKRVERREFSKDKDGAIDWTSVKKTIETNTVGIRGKLVHYTGMLMPEMSPYGGQYWDHFHVEESEIVSNHAEFSEVKNASGISSTYYVSTVGRPGVSELRFRDTSLLKMIYDSDKKKLLDAKLPGNFVDTNWTIKHDEVSTRDGVVTDEKHTSSDSKESFSVMRIEDGNVPLEINGGDKNYYGSENERTEIYETLPDGGYVKGFIEKTFDWDISLE